MDILSMIMRNMAVNGRGDGGVVIGTMPSVPDVLYWYHQLLGLELLTTCCITNFDMIFCSLEGNPGL